MMYVTFHWLNRLRKALAENGQVITKVLFEKDVS